MNSKFRVRCQFDCGILDLISITAIRLQSHGQYKRRNRENTPDSARPSEVSRRRGPNFRERGGILIYYCEELQKA